MIFIEAIFANHPYSTVYGYKEKNGKMIPIMDKSKFDAELFYDMETYLEKFVNEFYSLHFIKKIETMERFCSDVSLYWYRDHQDDPFIVKSLGHLLDSVEIYGTVREFAPAFTSTTITLLKQGKSPTSLTRSLKISLARSTPAIRSEYQAIIKNSQKTVTPIKQSIPRKIRLQAKLENTPEAFFTDSKNRYVRFAGQLCFSRVLRPSLGRALIFVTKKVLKNFSN